MSNKASHRWTWWFFTLTSLRWLAHELTDCLIITEILRWIISPFIFSLCGPHGQPSPCCWCESGFKNEQHWLLFLGRQDTFPYKYKCGSWSRPWLCPVVVTCGRQISPENPWALSIFRANSETVWARKLLLLTAAMVCGVRGHRSRVFLLTLCIEFKQEQHSCGNTLLQTPKDTQRGDSFIFRSNGQ